MKIDNKEQAWLAFLCEDSPEVIVRLIKKYPEFRAMYALQLIAIEWRNELAKLLVM